MRFFRSVLTTGIPFALVITLLLSILVGPARALRVGPPGGLLFGLMLATFVSQQRKRMNIEGGVLDGERILHQGPANHKAGAEMRGGWLVLTERAVVFRSHGMNIENAPLRIPLGDLRGFSGSSTLGLIPNGLLLQRSSGQLERFVVSDRGEWLEAFRNLIQANQANQGK